MATSYTGNLKLGKPAVADRQWNLALNANADLIDSLSPISGLCVTPKEMPSASLNIHVAAGKYRKQDGTVGAYAGTSTYAVAAGQTTSLYLNDAGVLTASLTGYPTTSHVRLATIAATAMKIGSVVDDRVVCTIVGTDAGQYLALTGGTLFDGATIDVGSSVGARIAASPTGKLGFWGAVPVARPSAYSQIYTTSTKTLTAYTANTQSTVYVGIASGQSGSTYAQITDLNNLRAAYENLRKLNENTAQVLNALLNDLRAVGLIA